MAGSARSCCSKTSSAQSDGPWRLRRVRAESGHIVVTQIPPLHLPGDYRTVADALLSRIMGGAETG